MIEVLGADAVVYLADSEVLDFDTEDMYVNRSKSSATFWAGMRHVNLHDPAITVDYLQSTFDWPEMGKVAHVFGWRINRDDGS